MKVGSRESKLAMRQTEIFVQRMAEANPGDACEVIGIKALGDIDLKSRLDELPATGAFVRELDDAMLRGRSTARSTPSRTSRSTWTRTS